MDPIENRFRDDEARPQATRDLLKHILDHKMAVQSVATSDRDAVGTLSFLYIESLMTVTTMTAF